MIEYNDLLLNYNNNEREIPYYELLKTSEWKGKRIKILERDNFTCQKCEKKMEINIDGKYFRKLSEMEYNEQLMIAEKEKRRMITEIGFAFALPNPDNMLFPLFLHVHHHYYILNNLPWEYDDNALITYCQECHQNFHDNNKPEVYLNADLLNVKNLNKCLRCNGSGFLHEYYYVENGICFRCKGKKYEELINHA